MNLTVTRLLYVLLALLSALLLMEGHSLLRLRQISFKKRRKLMRIKVPPDKAITCRVLEPLRDASTKEFLVDDITMAGISFFADHRLEREIVKLSIRFPFTTHREAATVWGKVAYSAKCGTEERYRTGISYMKRAPRPGDREHAHSGKNGEK